MHRARAVRASGDHGAGLVVSLLPLPVLYVGLTKIIDLSTGAQPYSLEDLRALARQFHPRFFSNKNATLFSKPFWTWIFLAVVVTFGVLRNVPVAPFTYLKP